ncbi:MAG: metal ABC transporter solute-binding protein, Zn/Mn family [Paracoccaceae bacterium]
MKVRKTGLLICGFLLLIRTYPLAARELNVVVDIAPTRAIVAEVAGSGHGIVTLVPDGVSPHDFALRPSQVRALVKADLIVWMGPVATPGLRKIMTRPEFAAKALPLNRIRGTHLLTVRRAGLNLVQPRSVGVESERFDPHSWLDPENAVVWATAISAEFARTDPENAEDYELAAKALTARINGVKSDIRAGLQSLPSLDFVQFHDGFQYFENAFGLVPLGMATAGDMEETSLKTIAALSALLKASGGACVFTANDREAARASMLLNIGNVRAGRIDPLGRNIVPGAFDYPTLLQSIADGFSACFSGGE